MLSMYNKSTILRTLYLYYVHMYIKNYVTQNVRKKHPQRLPKYEYVSDTFSRSN